MVGRFFARTMMIVLMVVAIWLISLTWQVYPGTYGAKVFFTMMASSLFLSNLTLLIQSIMSFNTYHVKRDNPWALIGGYLLTSETRDNNFTTHYCLLSWARSFMLAMFTIILSMIAMTLYLFVSGLINFILHPYMPSIPIRDIGLALGVFSLGILGVYFFDKLYKRIVNINIIARWLLYGVYIAFCAGFILGTLMYLFDSSAGDYPWLMFVYMASGVAVVLMILGVIVAGVSYGIVKLVQKASERYSVLGKIWNTLCPVQEINILR